MKFYHKDKDFKEVILDRESDIPYRVKHVSFIRKIYNLFSKPQKPIRYYYYSIFERLYSFDGFQHCPYCNETKEKKRKSAYWICFRCNQKVLYSTRIDLTKFEEEELIYWLKALIAESEFYKEKGNSNLGE